MRGGRGIGNSGQCSRAVASDQWSVVSKIRISNLGLVLLGTGRRALATALRGDGKVK
jgi:hypothetical protein